jgi:hypothetical protein
LDENDNSILTKRKEYERDVTVQQLIQELKSLRECVHEDTEVIEDYDGLRRDVEETDAHILSIPSFGGMSVVPKREGVIPKKAYCELMQKTKEQRALILEFIHRIHTPGSEPIQIFFHGPAGCGKTFTLKLLMETCNRFTQQRNKIRNVYLSCASTGKAASAIDATTVHSPFRIAAMRTGNKPMSRENEQNYRGLFDGVIVRDQYGRGDIFRKIYSRLKQITAGCTSSCVAT